MGVTVGRLLGDVVGPRDGENVGVIDGAREIVGAEVEMIGLLEGVLVGENDG